MNIYTVERNCLIQTNLTSIVINSQEFHIHDYHSIEEMVHICTNALKQYWDDEMHFDFKPRKFSHTDTILLIVLGQYKRQLYCDAEKRFYDIVFSYNFPLVYEKHLIPTIIESFNEIVNAQLIALGIASEFIVVDVSSNDAYSIFQQKYNYLFRRNNRQINIQPTSLHDVLINWKNYCERKFKQIYSIDAIKAYMNVYALDGFEPLAYYYQGELIAQGVRYKSVFNQTIYYCIFSWIERYKSFSPGIYAYIKTIELCHDIGYKFSFCYGLQPYKIKLLDSFERV